MYGLDSSQLNEADIKKLEKNYLQGLRKILKLDTTYGQLAQGLPPTNTIEKVFSEAQIEFNKSNNEIVLTLYLSPSLKYFLD